MKKILVTGAGGFVGSRVMQQWAGRYELCAFPKGFLAAAGEDAVRQAIFQQRPDVILHTAAISDTGYCADHPEQAYRANVELPVWLARAAAETDAKLVAFSSDQVYAGVERSGPLPETIPQRIKFFRIAQKTEKSTKKAGDSVCCQPDRVGQIIRKPCFFAYLPEKSSLIGCSISLCKKSYLFYILSAFCYNIFAFLQSIRTA